VNNAQGDVARFNSVREAYEMSKEITSQRYIIEQWKPYSAGWRHGLTSFDVRCLKFLHWQISERRTGGCKMKN
jgi:hypothetical protein